MFTRRTRKSRSRALSRKGTRKCPKGFILRKGYIRAYRNTIIREGYKVHRAGKTVRIRPTTSKAYVPSQCIKDRGLPGKGKNIFGDLKEGELLKHGYGYRLPDKFRHVALERAVDEYGPLEVYHKLNAVSKLSTRTAPAASKIFSKDREWIKSKYIK